MEHFKTHKLKYAAAAALVALILVMVFFGVDHDGFSGLNK